MKFSGLIILCVIISSCSVIPKEDKYGRYALSCDKITSVQGINDIFFEYNNGSGLHNPMLPQESFLVVAW